MKRLALIAVVACSSSGGPHVHPLDAPGLDSACVYTGDACSPLLQAGCAVAQKCTWVELGSDTSIGLISCAPDGNQAAGQSCSATTAYSIPGCGDYLADDCVKGAVCVEGVCKTVCDDQGGMPMCGSAEACVTVPGLFQYGSAYPPAAGVCVPACDPLADNDLLGSGVRGSGCTAGSGCYGVPSRGTGLATQFDCEAEGSGVHRSVATGETANACAEGYEPLVREATGSTTIVCVALCAPGDTYLGGPHAPLGIAPHRCASSDARGSFGAREHCMYSWRFEQDGSGHLLRSPSSDAVGVCIDHAQYRYDSNGDGVIDGSDSEWPDCAALPLSGSGLVAADLGCVATTTAPALPVTPPPGL